MHMTTRRLGSGSSIRRWPSVDVQSSSIQIHDLFDLLCDENGKLKKSEFLYRITDAGLRWNDPRLENVIRELLPPQLARRGGKGGGDVGMLIDTSGELDSETFHKIVSHNLDLIERAIKHDFIIPDFKDFCQQLERVFNDCKQNSEGKVATYIPQLAKKDPNYWAMSVCTVDGQRFSLGDVDVPFCIQSCVKPLSYSIALQELGPDTVHRYVGQEPSGLHFNAVSLDSNNRPHNPMVNAGAIVVCSLLKPEWSLSERFDYISKFMKKLSGGEFVGFNNSVFLSERESADRNFALAYYMREHKCFPDGSNLMETLDFYFQTCSVEVNCESASVMAATLANGGICPITSENVLDPKCVCNTLSLMLSCGMYDYSGQFAFKIGVPAKSGVSGAIMLVIPNIAGICVYSPKLDELGNSCRGIMFSEILIREFNFHHLDSMRRVKYKCDPRQRRTDKPVNSVLSLIYSAAAGDIMSVTRHALDGCDMGAADYDSRTALHLAATEGHLNVVKYLINRCHVLCLPRDRWGNTPLCDAQKQGHTEVVQFIRQAAIEREEPLPMKAVVEEKERETAFLPDNKTAALPDKQGDNKEGTRRGSGSNMPVRSVSDAGDLTDKKLADVKAKMSNSSSPTGSTDSLGVAGKVPPVRPPPPTRESPSRKSTGFDSPQTRK